MAVINFFMISSTKGFQEVEANLSHHSILMPAALMIGHHFSVSAWCQAASASGVCCSRGTTSWPKEAKRACTPGSASAFTIAVLSLPTIAFGVPLGAQMPYQDAV